MKKFEKNVIFGFRKNRNFRKFRSFSKYEKFQMFFKFSSRSVTIPQSTAVGYYRTDRPKRVNKKQNRTNIRKDILGEWINIKIGQISEKLDTSDL